MIQHLQFCFKGDRSYVHGTDIFNAVSDLLGMNVLNSQSVIEMSIHNIVRNNLTVYINSDLPKDKHAAVYFFVKAKNIETKIALVENEQAVICRYEYDEDKTIAAANININEKTIELVAYNDYTFIENIVALNKGLLLALYPEKSGKWYFARVRLNNLNPWLDHPNHISLRLIKNLSFKLTQTEILINDKSIGSIYFSLV
jgi:hypothetical protein